MSRKRLAGLEPSGQYNPDGTLRLEKKGGGGCLKAFIITLIVVFVLIIIVAVGGLLVGNWLIKENLGVTLWDLFSVSSDLKKTDYDYVVTNGFNDNLNDTNNDISGTNGFYNSVRKAAFLNGQAPIDEFVDNLMSGLTGGSGDIDTDTLYDIFKAENIDTAALAGYSGWKSGNEYNHTGKCSDRQLGAVMNAFIKEILSDSVGEIIPGLDTGNVVVFKQFNLCEGSTMLAAAEPVSKLYYNNIEDDHVYMTLTVSFKIENVVDGLINYAKTSMGTDIGFAKGIINWLLPKEVLLSLTLDMQAGFDADGKYNAQPIIEMNKLSRYEVNYKAPGADEAAMMTKMDKLNIIIDTIFAKVGGSNQSLQEMLGGMLENVIPNIVENDEADFSLGNMIDLSTIKKKDNDTYNEFDIDLFSTVVDMLNVDNLSAKDIIIMMQAVICTDSAEKILLSVPGVPENDNSGGRVPQTSAKIERGGPSLYDNEIGDIGDYQKLLDTYGEDFIKDLISAYGIDEEYVVDEVTGETARYSNDDILSMLGMNNEEETEGAKALKKAIDDATKIIVEPVIPVTDKTLYMVVDSKMEKINSDLPGNYNLVLEKCAINEEIGGDGKMHSYVTIYCSFDISSLTGNDTVRNLVDNLLGGKTMLFAVTQDITLDAQVTRDPELALIINGLDGNPNVLNGLSTEDLLASISLIGGFNKEDLLPELEGVVDDAIKNINNSPLVGIKFEPSKPL